MINPDEVPYTDSPGPWQCHLCHAEPCCAKHRAGGRARQVPTVPLAPCHGWGCASGCGTSGFHGLRPLCVFLMYWTSHLESWGQFWAPHDKTVIERLECIQGLERGLIPSSGI